VSEPRRWHFVEMLSAAVLAAGTVGAGATAVFRALIRTETEAVEQHVVAVEKAVTERVQGLDTRITRLETERDGDLKTLEAEIAALRAEQAGVKADTTTLIHMHLDRGYTLPEEGNDPHLRPNGKH